jgi:predicted HicB family RNase H-like nuclease
MEIHQLITVNASAQNTSVNKFYEENGNKMTQDDKIESDIIWTAI